MKVVQINAVYGIGSTGRMVQDIHRALIEEGHESYVFWGIKCTHIDDSAHFYRIGNNVDHKIHAVLRRIGNNQGFHSRLSTLRACRQIKRLKPNIAHLHNLHSNYIHLPTLLSFLGKENIPTLVTMHDCWYMTGNCMHYIDICCDRWKHGCKQCPKYKGKVSEKLYIKKHKGFHSLRYLAVNGVSQWTTLAAKEAPILSESRCNRCIYNWVDTAIFYPRETSEKIKEKYNISAEKKVILGVSQGWSNEKGLLEIVALSEEIKERAIIILVGDTKQVPSRKNIISVGYTDSQDELAELYSAADVLVNPSRMETFGLVTAEAMACGTPVLAYDNTGTRELVSSDCGRIVRNGDITAFVAAACCIMEKSKSIYSENCLNRVKHYFDKKSQVSSYLRLYEEMLEK